MKNTPEQKPNKALNKTDVIGSSFTHGSLFSGIGGFDLASEWMGWENVFHCEWNGFGKKVLKHYWPNSISYDDITKTDFSVHRGTIDVLTGGFPCQPYSVAGKRKGKEDERHLWPEMLRAIREIQPRWIVGENVLGLVNWNGGLVFHEVQTDLEAQGYEVQPFILPAASVNAPHKRDRVWFVAYSHDKGRSAGFGEVSKKNGKISQCNESAELCNTNDRFVKNTYENGRRSDEWEKESDNRQQRNFGTGDNERISTYNDESGNVTHSENERYEQCAFGNNIERSSTRCTEREFERSSSIPADTNSRRQSGKKHRETESGQFTKTSFPGYWENFPTQSPVCNGNDGIPTELDGITFPKWRNESIKAGGNAIVPQVVYQIFKSIESYEQHYL